MSINYPPTTDADPSHAASQSEAIRRAKNAAATELLDEWSAGDATEQRETWKYLRRVLDEDRLSQRKLFPAE